MTTVDLTTETRSGAVAAVRSAVGPTLHLDNVEPPAYGPDLRSALSLRTRIGWTLGALVLGAVVAGLWNYKVVDGFGREFVAGRTIGDISGLGSTFEANGFGWGFVFAWIAGLAATFTACNCVVYAMLPGLTCTTEGASSRRSALKAIGAFSLAVVVVGAFYGMFVGLLGPTGIRFYNESTIRLAQARATFTGIGLIMIIWGALEFGYIRTVVQRLSPITRAYFSSPHTKAVIMGVLVGLFAVGRPFPVFREFLTYAATANNPAYGAAVMALHGLGQIAIMIAVFMLLVYGLGDRLTRWLTQTPHRAALVTAVALVSGGSYFVYYWGLAFAFNIGQWGFKLGWYS